jgi:hypothetical protein
MMCLKRKSGDSSQKESEREGVLNLLLSLHEMWKHEQDDILVAVRKPSRKLFLQICLNIESPRRDVRR